MNRNLPKNLVLLALLLIPLWGWSQAVDLVTYQNSAISYGFSSEPNAPSIISGGQPEHGTLEAVSNSSTADPFDYVLTYTPDENFIGIDHFTISRWQLSPFPAYTLLNVTVTVAPALIQAYHDYAATYTNETVVVDVLANDISSNGIKVLQAVPAVNHGTATFDQNTGLITFTPRAGFKGTAHFNYALCNGIGDCADGTVSITVMEEEIITEDEEVSVFTKMETKQFILVPATYEHVSGPDNGIYDGGADVPEYTPAADFTGQDQIVFTDGNHTLTFNIEVLPLKDNVFAFDDRVFTTAGSPVEVDWQDNDGSQGSCGFQISAGAENGEVSLSNGNLVYTPHAGFVGVDQFTYRSYISGCMGEAEFATVTVFVSNFAPDRTTFEMATPKATPIIIGYNVPVSTFSFEVTSQGELGLTQFLQADEAYALLGEALPEDGNNVLVYIPNDGINEGLDEIEITYCLADPSDPDGPCMVSKQVKVWMTILDVGAGDGPVCVGDCVWAGDTNSDGVVNMADLLPIGRSMGEIGATRAGATMDMWYGQYAEDWGSLFSGTANVDVKHIDADGNSIVTAADTTAIREFYGLTHNMVPNVMAYAPYEFVLEGPLFVNPGDYVTLSLSLGNASQPVEDIYGFVFPLQYNPQAANPYSISINWLDDNFLSYDSPVLYMDHNNGAGLFEAGYTRTSGLVSSGHGQVAELGIVIDDLIGVRTDEPELLLSFGGGAGASLDQYGNYNAIPVQPFQMRVRLQSDEEAAERPLTDDLLIVSPNPASDRVDVHLNGQQEFEQLVLRSLTGQVLLVRDDLRTNHQALNVGHLPAGIYVLSVSNEKGTLNRKVQIAD
ncbi:MAG: Ig-like domain-containing protein [Bacteroidota bacterium]